MQKIIWVKFFNKLTVPTKHNGQRTTKRNEPPKKTVKISPMFKNTPHPLERQHGQLEVIVGPMFSGKSEELIRRVTRALIAKQNVVVFKPALDNRYHASAVASHNGRSVAAHAVQDSHHIQDLLEGDSPLFSTPETQAAHLHIPHFDVIAIDEIQFFDPRVVELALEWVQGGIRVILAGLDLDFRGEPFAMVPELLARAEQVDKLSAICMVCGAPATRTQRLIGGNPARYHDPIVMVGASESYEARCRTHHQVLGHERLGSEYNPRAEQVTVEVV
jgi:thymidine kinase